jgi:hypothetical protein
MRQHAADASACRPAVEADTAAVTALRSGKVKDISPNGRVVPRSLNRVLRLAVLGRPPSHQRTRPSLLGAYRVAGRIHGECPPG